MQTVSLADLKSISEEDRRKIETELNRIIEVINSFPEIRVRTDGNNNNTYLATPVGGKEKRVQVT